MGSADVNLIVGPHLRTGTLRGFVLRVHLGNAALDVESDDATPAHYADVRAAVMSSASDAVLDAAGEAAWGTWYKNYVEEVPGARAQLRAAVPYVLASV